jgi:dTDP-4-amino-4,6-dideoxygalactose transaminase
MPSTPSSASTAVKVPYTNLPSQYEEFRTDLLNALETVFKRGDYILGEPVRLFEERFARYVGAKHAIGVANGTDALVLLLKAFGIGAGDEVITAPNSFVASASAIALAGARPVFADVRDDLNIDPSAVASAITPRTKAIIPVHLAGRCADMPALKAIASKQRLPLLEDAAQAVGSKLAESRSGALGTAAAFSLHPLKNLNAMGDAGVITTQDDALAEKLRLLRNHGLKNRDAVSFWGFNSRLDSVQAAILNVRFEALDHVIERRRQIAARYRQRLAPVVKCPDEKAGEFHTYHLFVIQAPRRDELQRTLTEQGIETKVHYPIPIHLQEAAASLGYRPGSFPVCERLAGTILSLPVHQYLSDPQVDLVCEAILRFYEHP